MGARTLRVATRASRLAKAQAGLAARALRAANKGLGVELVGVVSEGDKVQGPLAAHGGKDLFVGAVRQAVRDGRAHCACHSLKDMGQEQQGFVTAAFLRRADPRDALVGARLSVLAAMRGPKVATSSPRRSGQLSCNLPAATAVPVRGNVDTRLAKLEKGLADALVLACAGLDRLGLASAISERLDPEVFVPAPGQGTIALECLDGDYGTQAILATVDDAAARQVSVAERECAKVVSGDCHTPLGAHATVGLGGKIAVRCALSFEGRNVCGSASCADPAEAGNNAALMMLSAGGAQLLRRSTGNGGRP